MSTRSNKAPRANDMIGLVVKLEPAGASGLTRTLPLVMKKQDTVRHLAVDVALQWRPAGILPATANPTTMSFSHNGAPLSPNAPLGDLPVNAVLFLTVYSQPIPRRLGSQGNGKTPPVPQTADEALSREMTPPAQRVSSSTPPAKLERDGSAKRSEGDGSPPRHEEDGATPGRSGGAARRRIVQLEEKVEALEGQVAQLSGLCQTLMESLYSTTDVIINEANNARAAAASAESNRSALLERTSDVDNRLDALERKFEAFGIASEKGFTQMMTSFEELSSSVEAQFHRVTTHAPRYALDQGMLDEAVAAVKAHRDDVLVANLMELAADVTALAENLRALEARQTLAVSPQNDRHHTHPDSVRDEEPRSSTYGYE